MQAPPLAVALLGPPVIEVDGRPLAVDTRKATALLAYLAVSGRPARRDTLASLLWPEADPDRARSALRRTLSTLRAALGGRFLDAGREAISLDLAEVSLDVAEFRRLLADCRVHGHDDGWTCDECLRRLEAAAALHRGEFLAGFGLRDSVEFDDWQQRTADELRREVAAALDLLVDAFLSRDNHAQAIAFARRRLALDALHEPAHRRLMQAYAAAGDRSSALEQYRTCVRVLDRELGVRPLEETSALYHAVLDGSYPRPPEPAAPVAVDGGGLDHALVGRGRELDLLTGLYAEVGPDGRLAALVGEAGIGKTRLGEELLAIVAARGGTTVSVRAFEEEAGIAYGLATELVRTALQAGDGPDPDGWWLEEAARLLPELGPAPAGPIESAGAQARLNGALVELLARAIAPGAVFLDDLHWADDASLRFIRYLAHRLAGRPLLLVLSWRPEDVSSRHPVGRLGEAGTIVSLGRLSAAEVSDLAGRSGHSGELGVRLYQETDGLPFFVVEYLDALAREDADAVVWPVPGGVRDLLGARIAALSELAGQVLSAAAVLGRSFEAPTVRDASGRSEEETVAALDELLGRGLLLEAPDGTLDFHHPQARELAYEQLTLARRRLLHRRAAAALEARQRDAYIGVVANHLALAGDEEGAAEHYRSAGDRAAALYANAEALSHYEAALAHGYPDRAILHERIGDLQTLAGDYAAALASYETAAALAEDGRSAEIEHRIGAVHLRRGDWELADVSLAAAVESLPPSGLARAVADRSLVAHRRGRHDEAELYAAEALNLATAADDQRALAQARNILGVLASSSGAYEEAAAHLEASVALARTAGDAAAEAAALNNLALAVAAAGDTDRAIELARSALALVVTLGDRHREAALRSNLADRLHAAGHGEEAIEELKVAAALFAEVGEEGKLEPEIWKLSEW